MALSYIFFPESKRSISIFDVKIIIKCAAKSHLDSGAVGHGHLGALLAIGVGDLALVLVLNLALLRVLVVTFLHTQMVTFEYILLLMLIKVTSLYSVLQFSFSNRWQFFSYSISTSKSS